MVPYLLERRPDAQVLFVGATDDVRRRLRRRGVLDHVVTPEPKVDEGALATMYAACDVFATTSSIGESFGASIAEAMTLGLPVVTSSTPWTDNAQVELVETGVNGYVANHPRSFAEAIAALFDDEERRAALGRAAAEKAASHFSSIPLTRQLEELYSSLLRDGEAPGRWSPSLAEFVEFERDYPMRARAEFRPLTFPERVARALRVASERGRWFVTDLRRKPLKSLGWNLSRGVKRLRPLGRRASGTQ
jgi:hypothetical protein